MVFFQIALLLFFFKSTCLAEQVLISLGENCNVAVALSQHGLRKQSLPFDWNITPFQSLFDIFLNDFSNFLRPEDLLLDVDLHTVVNQHYHIKFAHDFPTFDYDLKNEHDLAIPIPGVVKPDFLDALPNVKEKYDRRIKRLYHILNEDNEVLFIRHNHQHVLRGEVIKFCELIQEKFPTLKFTLILWGYEDEMSEEWGHPRIKTYQLVRGDNIEAFYENLFRSLSLIH
jgi:hypothetical protein